MVDAIFVFGLTEENWRPYGEGWKVPRRADIADQVAERHGKETEIFQTSQQTSGKNSASDAAVAGHKSLMMHSIIVLEIFCTGDGVKPFSCSFIYKKCSLVRSGLLNAKLLIMFAFCFGCNSTCRHNLHTLLAYYCYRRLFASFGEWPSVLSHSVNDLFSVACLLTDG